MADFVPFALVELPAFSGPRRTKDGKILVSFDKPSLLSDMFKRTFGNKNPTAAQLGLDQVPPDMLPQLYDEAKEAGETSIMQAVAAYAKQKGITIPGVTDRPATNTGGSSMGGNTFISRYGVALAVLAAAAVGSAILLRRRA